MIRFLEAIQSSFNDIRILISGGTIEPKNNEIRMMMKEAYEIDIIPHFGQDRANLKNDRDHVTKDYIRAKEKAEQEGTNRKQLELQF